MTLEAIKVIIIAHFTFTFTFTFIHLPMKSIHYRSICFNSKYIATCLIKPISNTNTINTIDTADCKVLVTPRSDYRPSSNANRSNPIASLTSNSLTSNSLISLTSKPLYELLDWKIIPWQLDAPSPIVNDAKISSNSKVNTLLNNNHWILERTKDVLKFIGLPVNRPKDNKKKKDTVVICKEHHLNPFRLKSCKQLAIAMITAQLHSIITNKYSDKPSSNRSTHSRDVQSNDSKSTRSISSTNDSSSNNSTSSTTSTSNSMRATATNDTNDIDNSDVLCPFNTISANTMANYLQYIPYKTNDSSCTSHTNTSSKGRKRKVQTTMGVVEDKKSRKKSLNGNVLHNLARMVLLEGKFKAFEQGRLTKGHSPGKLKSHKQCSGEYTVEMLSSMRHDTRQYTIEIQPKAEMLSKAESQSSLKQCTRKYTVESHLNGSKNMSIRQFLIDGKNDETVLLAECLLQWLVYEQIVLKQRDKPMTSQE